MSDEDFQFENDVRRIARQLWPTAQFSGASMEEGRERDGVFETDECVHIIECTVSRGRDKATDDARKIAKLIRTMGPRKPLKAIQGWFITRAEPTAEQRSAVEHQKSRIVALSFDQFRSRLVDAKTYLDLRRKYPFGSVRDPRTGGRSPDLQYIPLDLVASGQALNRASDLASDLEEGARVVLLGDYGVGKSATMRELFLLLAQRFCEHRSARFPLLLNLRDHHGQVSPVEAIERHGRNLGFTGSSQLVRAWRAGYVILMLDGFDEVAAAGWAGKVKKLRDLRRYSMEMIRSFVRETPEGTSIVIAGRAHFFDSNTEMESALALERRFLKYTLLGFSPEQAGEYLRRMGVTGALPDWLPTRPLLLTYLAANGLLADAVAVDDSSGPAQGWDYLLDKVSEREAEIESGLDGSMVRRLVESLATAARHTADGLGPLTPDTIIEEFRAVCGSYPDDRGAVLLQRLPGLGAHQAEDGTRVFIDRDFAEAARGGDVFNYTLYPYKRELQPETWQASIEGLGASLAAHKARRANHGASRVLAALEQTAKKPSHDTLSADLLLVLNELGSSYKGPVLYLREVILPELYLEDCDVDLSCVELQDCVVGTLRLSAGCPHEHLPRFLRCHFGFVEGRTGMRDLPCGRFTECSVDEFEGVASTTHGIMELTLPLGFRVLLTILKKLYAQKGAGRKESAFFRGLDQHARELVTPALGLLRRERFASRARVGDDVVWLPTKSGDVRRRALTILAGPSTTRDPLIDQSRHLEA